MIQSANILIQDIQEQLGIQEKEVSLRESLLRIGLRTRAGSQLFEFQESIEEERETDSSTPQEEVVQKAETRPSKDSVLHRFSEEVSRIHVQSVFGAFRELLESRGTQNQRVAEDTEENFSEQDQLRS